MATKRGKRVEDRESRVTGAREIANELLDQLEDGTVPVAQSLMKAKRLARLLRDTDTQKWLDYETRGYPDEGFSFDELGAAAKYARQGGRIGKDDKYWLTSLPELEARITAERVALDGMKFPTHVAPSASSANTVDMAGLNVSNAVKQLPALFAAEVEKIKGRLAQSSRLFHGLKSALHNYVTDVHIALTLGDAAETIFEQARARVDTFVRAHCPGAAEKLLAINDRLNDADKESLTQALTSCRRLLGAVADAVYPPRAEPHVDSKGTKRKVGQEEYKNRILAFVEERVASGSTKALLESELEHLVARVDSAYEKACKGVHADVSIDETRLAILQTYILLGEVARLMPGPSKSGKGQG